MRNYRVRVCIENVDKGPAEQSEVILGNMPFESIADAVKAVSAYVVVPPKDAVSEHERLVELQNKNAESITN